MSDSSVPPLGRHAFIELSGCPVDLLESEDLARSTIAAAVERSGATLLQLVVHRFQPHGLTALGLLAESHISIHTWPERGFAAVDVFMCGDAQPMKTIPALKQAFSPDRIGLQEIKRGLQA